MRRNRTRFAVLGMLMDGPKSGYDLKQHFEERIRHFWCESLGQIYPTLHRLRDEGLVSARTRQRQGRPARTVYTLTAKGKMTFRDWLAQPAAPETVRNELLLKIFFGPEMTPEQSLEHLERHQARLTELRALYKHFGREIERLAGNADQKLYWNLALSSGQHVVRARIAWCREAKVRIREHLGTNPAVEGAT